MTALRRSLIERRFDLGQRDTTRFEQYQQMVKQIGRFRDQTPFVLLDGGQTGLYRLLAQFLGAVSDALVDQRTRIRFRRRSPWRARAPAFPDLPA